MEGNKTPAGNNHNRNTNATRRSARKNSTQEEEIVLEVTTAVKRRRQSSGDKMSKNKKPNNGDINPTNAQLMSTLDRLADKMDQLPNKADLQNVEAELLNKMQQSAIKFDKRIQDNAREIRAVNNKIDKHADNLAKLEEEFSKQKRSDTGGVAVAEMRRKQAQEDKYIKARRSFRVWPILIGRGEQAEVCVRRFFIISMQVPASLAKDVEIEHIKKAIQSHPRSRIHDEFIITFKETEARDAIKAYASGLATSQGKAGLRLELTDVQKGSYRILDEHGLAIKDLYGPETKRNIKFDDRTRDLMMDVKLPGNSKWHNITADQAKKAKRFRDDAEIGKLSQGRAIAGPSQDRERAKALMLVYSPDTKSSGTTLATGANLIDIECSFGGGGAGEEEAAAAESGEEGSGNESDESMARMLHAHTGRPR